MCFLAAEMERQGLNVPLLIGGATTSRVHTAVKIDPNYRGGPVVHVNDASRAVGVASALLSPEKREAYAAEIRAEYAKIAAAHVRAQADKRRLSLSDARANAVKIDLAKVAAGEADLPRHQELRRLSTRRAGRLYRLDAVLPDLGAGRALSRDPRRSPRSARPRARCSTMRRRCSKQIVDEKWFTRARHDRLLAGQCRRRRHRALCRRERAAKQIATLHTLRQQLEKREGRFNAALSDFIAPQTSGVPDYIGALRRHRGDRRGRRSPTASSTPMTTTPRSWCKALADRLAEAFAERMHQRVRKRILGLCAGRGAVAATS